MSKIRNGAAAYRKVRDAIKGPHQGAMHAPTRITTFSVGDTVKVRKTGVIAKISTIKTWGDYELEGIEGFFSGSQLDLISPVDA